MMEDCRCRKSLEYDVADARKEADRVRAERLKRLEAFREGIAQGAREVAARHLYLAGVYSACLDNGFVREPDGFMIMGALRSRKTSMTLNVSDFFSESYTVIQGQAEFVDIRNVLKGVLRIRSKAQGLLMANTQRELGEAGAALERLRRLEEMLLAWRSLNPESKVGLESIVDMHV